MSTVPFWFDSNAYVKNKASVMGMDNLTLLQAFKNAGFSTDADGLYAHFQQFGNSESISPNAFFNTSQYLYTKAASYFGTGSVTDQQAKSMDLAMNQAGFSPWVHFQQYWAEDFASKGTFHNPSSTFDTNKYMNDKLAQMQANPAYGTSYTMAQLVAAFQAAGLDPVSHYIIAGQTEGLAPKAIGTGTAGATYQLTTGDDEFYGTTGNDYFNAKVDTLNDRDYIDGGAGNDTLYANIKAGGTANTAIAPEIVNVENIIFRAQTTSTTGGGNNNSDAYIDAGNIRGMTLLGNDNSRASLAVEDVRTDSNKMTIRMSNTDPGNVDFSVYFDSQHLKAQESTTSGTLYAQLIDTIGALPTAQGGQNNPLWDNPYTGFKFTLAGVEHTLNFGAYNHTTDSTPTYAELAAAMQAAINADPALSGLGLTVTLGDPFTATVGIGPNQGATVTGTQIDIKSAQGALGEGNWIAANGLPPTNSTSATFDSTSTTSCPLIQTNVQLDNVGRVQWDDASPCLPDDSINGTQAGDLVIGSMAGRLGVERFDVTVDRGSWLSSMSSTNNTLRMVTVVNGEVNGDARDNNNGNLFIGQSLASNDVVGTTSTDLTTWMNVPRLLTTDGLVDVKTFDASEMIGKVNVGASLTSASFEKYLKDVDGVNTMAESYAPNGPFSYKLGHNDDTLNMIVEGGIVADQDFVLNIATGDGNDLVNYVSNFKTVNQHLDQVALHNVNIDLGAGNDTLWTWGVDVGGTQYAGRVDVVAGEGNDAIYLGQTAADQNAVFLFNIAAAAPAGDRAITVNAVGGAQPLNNDILSTTPTFAYSGATVGTALTVTVNFKGISSTVEIATPTTVAGSLTAQHVNEAIAHAINDNSVLGKLLVAKDGAGYSLMVESIMDGLMIAGDLAITFAGATTLTSLATGYGLAQFATVGGTDVAGTNGGTIAVNRVDGGAGNDVIVLGADAGTVLTNFDTVALSGNSFGNDVVMNFTTTVDKVDISSYGAIATSTLVQSGALGTTVPANWATVLNAQAVAVDLGSNVVFVENTTTNGINDYYVFRVTAAATGTVAATDTVTLLGTVTTPSGTIADGDIVHI